MNAYSQFSADFQKNGRPKTRPCHELVTYQNLISRSAKRGVALIRGLFLNNSFGGFRGFLETLQVMKRGLFSKLVLMVSLVSSFPVWKRKHPFPRQPPSSTPSSDTETKP